jgi:hypothetical protein
LVRNNDYTPPPTQKQKIKVKVKVKIKIKVKVKIKVKPISGTGAAERAGQTGRRFGAQQKVQAKPTGGGREPSPASRGLPVT